MNIKKNQNIEIVFKVVLFLTIFSLPTNFFLVWRTAQSYWLGHFIDFWAPKLALSHIFIVLLSITWLWYKKATLLPKIRPAQIAHFRLKDISYDQLVVFFALALLLIRQLFTPNPMASFVWYINILLAFLLFFVLRAAQLPRLTFLALWLSTTGQSLLGLAQYWQNGSIFGYWFFGEPSLSSQTSFLAHSTWLNQVQILPYGTTPHPNILAAWILLSLITLPFWLIPQIKIPNKGIQLLSIFFIFISFFAQITTFFLTESLSAWASLGVLLLLQALYYSRKWTPPLWSGLVFGAFLTIFTLAIGSLTLWGSQNNSWYRRSSLLWMGIEAFPDHILFGTGWNQHITAYSPQAVHAVQAGFWQPIHNIVFYLVIENGICITLLFLYFLIKDQNNYSKKILATTLFLPILYLDHYLLSNFSGNLLLSIIFVFLIFRNRK